MDKTLLGRTGLEATRLGAGAPEVGLKRDAPRFERAGRGLVALLDAG